MNVQDKIRTGKETPISDAEARHESAGASGSEADKISKLARQIARQLGDESYSPAMVTGMARLFEVCLIRFR